LRRREKIIPALCEFDVHDVAVEELADAKFKTGKASAPLRLKIDDPFSEQSVQASGKPEIDGSEQQSVEHKGGQTVRCREVQPFCPPALVPTLGIAGSGPVAACYVNALYMYPLQLEKCQYRNVAVRVQLLQAEVDAVRGVEETDEAVLRAVYRANNQVGRSAYVLVGYHQKNPQFEDEIKICLPECLTPEHHLLLTFYHVHCKKLQPTQPQQELVGYAALPILGKDGTILQDGKYAVNVTPAPASPKPSATGGGVSLPPGYVGAARDGVVDNNKTVFSCRSRVVSSIHSQDSAVAAFLGPFHGGRRADAVAKEDAIVSRLMDLGQSSAPNVRYFFFMIAKFVLGYLRYGTSLVRWSAFRTLLNVMEKASWNPRGSLKLHEMNRVLHNFVHVVFDEKSIDDPNVSTSPSKAPPKSERKAGSVFGALLETWHNVLSNKASIEENADTKRMSLVYSNVLLQLILKSIAMTLLDQREARNNEAASSLPATLDKNDEVMLERVLGQLVSSAGDTSNGLLVQKEVNRSVAYFCRGVFLVVNNVFPARVLERYVKGIDIQGDANSLRHIWFPFLHILVDFEFFPAVNGAASPDQQSSARTRAWLARAVFEKLLLVVDAQKEHKIRVDALKLLRRMLAAQVYNPRYQRPEQQEGIALLYYPSLPSIVQLTAPGKLLSSRGDGTLGTGAPLTTEAKSVLDLQKELLACVGHLLSSVSRSQLPFFFRSRDESGARMVRLNATEALTFYQRVVGQVLRPPTQGRIEAHELCDNNTEDGPESPSASGAATANPQFDEMRVHACLAVIQRMLETFLVAESAANSERLWQQLLSPDLSACESESSLSLLEHRLAHRRSFHRRVGGGVDASAALASKANGVDNASDPTQNGADGSTAHKSLPRNWSKHYAGMQQRRSAPSGAPEEKAASAESSFSAEGAATGAHSADVAALQHGVASTAMRTLQTAVDQYEPVIRLLEGPRTPRLGESDDGSALKGVSMGQAHVLLGSLTDLLFQLLRQSSSIDCLVTEAVDSDDPSVEETRPAHDFDESTCDASKPCFVVHLLEYLQAFVWRFPAALFAARLPGLPSIHDQPRVQLLVSIAATAKESAVRRHASMLLSQLFAVCYEQTGSFLLVKARVLKVLTSVFFPAPATLDSSLAIACAALRDLLDEMRVFATASRGNAVSLPQCFHLHFIDLLNDLTTKVHAFERWRGAFENPDGAHDFEEIEEGVDRVVDDISPHWLLEEKLVWLNALLRLHERRERFAEAVCCKIAAIECVQRAGLGNSADSAHLGRVQHWVVRELFVARSYAERADWIEQELSICELLLVCLKQQRRFHEYQETLRYVDTLVSRLAERQESTGAPHSSSNFSFYRVRYAGGCVPALIAKDEFIYKRSKFTSLGEFVGELKVMLRAKYPQCERVDAVPEPKPLTGIHHSPNVIFLRVTTVEEALPGELSVLKAVEPRSSTWRVAFKFAVPFTLGGSSSYGKTSEQMKRITFLSVAKRFPCLLNRQRVQRRHEDTQCPIDNSMDDIHKRCEQLRAEIAKESAGKTDLKSLTLVLKGSVDTHVHGGVPEVLDSFLAADPSRLVDAQGAVMNKHDSLRKRHELANLLVDFAQLCWQCLLISREAFRRSSQPGSSQHAPPPFVAPVAPLPPELVPHQLEEGRANSFLPPLPARSVPVLPSAKSPAPLPPSEADLSHLLGVEVSPLQSEFERSFAALVEQIKSKIPFAFRSQSSLIQLHHQTACLRATASCITTPAPVAPLPDS
jgi:hypothetical protein